jgi:hypothetical protein
MSLLEPPALESHKRFWDDGDQDCAWCDGDGDSCNPDNADPERKVTDWLPPVPCPRCGGSGKDPNP